jgi:eukaryotic-like serine/threonine-protein kinase
MAKPDPAEQIPALNAEFAGTPYSFVAAIGEGGMGAVYEVEHRTLKRKLVIKILRELDRPDLEDRLRLEAQALAQLTHPNLLSVVDYSHTPAGRPYLVSERLHGKTLKAALGATGALPVGDAVRFAMQALGGLSVAHRVGVVHRDIKLDNLFLCDGDEITPAHVKVIDFGIAKLVGAEENRTAIPVAPLAVPTAEGVMIGTPSFMSPEQVTDMPVDQRADIYGVGAVLYRLLTGRNVFLCSDVFQYATAHATEAPTPPSRFAQLPEGLDAVVLRALEKKPENRFQNAKQMIEALAPFADRPSLPPHLDGNSSPGLMQFSGFAASSAPPRQEHTEVIPAAAQPARLPALSAPAEASPAESAVVSAPASRAERGRGPVEIVALAVVVASLAAILYFALVLSGALG